MTRQQLRPTDLSAQPCSFVTKNDIGGTIADCVYGLRGEKAWDVGF